MTSINYFGTNAGDTVNALDLINTDYYKFYMLDGNDFVDPYYTDRSYYFSGGPGLDLLFGSSRKDTIHGGEDDDRLVGAASGDYLYGEAANDELDGGSGIDHLYGGQGRDYLIGGGDSDYFTYKKGESNSNVLRADTIQDWNGSQDYLDTTIAGTSTNYAEFATGATNIDVARQIATSKNLSTLDHVFLYNANLKKGFVLSDLDHNGSFETGVVLLNVDSASDVSYADII